MKKLLIIFLPLSLLGCSSPNKIPDDVLGVDTMKVIMWDMIRAGKLAENQYKKDTATMKRMIKQNYQTVFTLHGITKDRFYHSYSYYEAHADKNKILMDSLSSYASMQRQELYKPVHIR